MSGSEYRWALREHRAIFNVTSHRTCEEIFEVNNASYFLTIWSSLLPKIGKCVLNGKAGITCNSAKWRFGHHKIEYVVHVIDKYGSNFSEEEMQEILDVPPPQKNFNDSSAGEPISKDTAATRQRNSARVRRLLNTSQNIGRLVW